MEPKHTMRSKILHNAQEFECERRLCGTETIRCSQTQDIQSPLEKQWANSSQVLVYSSATLSFNNHGLGISCPQEGLWMGPRLLEFERN